MIEGKRPRPWTTALSTTRWTMARLTLNTRCSATRCTHRFRSRGKRRPSQSMTGVKAVDDGAVHDEMDDGEAHAEHQVQRHPLHPPLPLQGKAAAEPEHDRSQG